MDHKILFEALSTKRGHETQTEAQFVAKLIKHLASFGKHPVRIDAAGNIYYKQGETKTLFVAHTDTVHRRNGANSMKLYKQANVRFKKVSVESLEKACTVTADGDALGADDGAGVAILCHMLTSDVPGCYIFTRGEECGGIGATFIAENHTQFLSKYDRAICFDRRGYSDVITHQGGTRCASDAFGQAVADALNDNDLLYEPSDEGVYTDCKEFIDFVPECINISTGYHSEHGEREWLNLTHWRKLAQAAVSIDWESLPTERDPLEPDEESIFSFCAGMSRRREEQLYSKQLDLSDYTDVLSLAADGDSTLLEDLIASHYGLTIRETMALSVHTINQTALLDAMNMLPEAGLKYLKQLASPKEAVH